MSHRARFSNYSDTVKNVIKNVNEQNDHFSGSQCIFHFNQPCFILLNSANLNRYHCIFSNSSMRWRSYTLSNSCDIPEHFYDLILLHKQLGSEYVLPFAGHFRESSGYTVGEYQLGINLYSPTKISQCAFKETVYAMIMFLCAICQRLGGNTPKINQCSFIYTAYHPVLCNIGESNAKMRERLFCREEYFNEKKWKRFLLRKTMRDVIRYLRIVFPHYFQKKKAGKKCILNEKEDSFDPETHQLVCQSDKKSLLEVLRDFKCLMPNSFVRDNIIQQWISLLDSDNHMDTS